MNIQEQFNLVAKAYDENRRKFISCFDDYYIKTTDFIAKTLEINPETIYDLGSGTGLLPSFWYKYFPEAKYTLIDIAEEMLDIAKKRFEGIPNVKYSVMDYSKSLPENPADIIMSALSIHHLEQAEKKKLFKNIYSNLSEKGIFINYDQFCSENNSVNEKIENYWIKEIQASGISQTEYDRWLERKKLDRETSVQEEINWLKEAGFKTVECVYLKSKFAVILAIKN